MFIYTNWIDFSHQITVLMYEVLLTATGPNAACFPRGWLLLGTRNQRPKNLKFFSKIRLMHITRLFSYTQVK